MLHRLSEPLSLQQLADALGLTPRSVQACFKRVLAISPMSWLKLARIGKLRQLLWCGDMARFSIQQLMSRCGLSDSSINRQYYKNAYGVSPKEERRQAEAIKRQYATVKKRFTISPIRQYASRYSIFRKIKQFGWRYKPKLPNSNRGQLI